MNSQADNLEALKPPSVSVPSAGEAPVRQIKSSDLRTLGQNLSKLWEQYRSDRFIAEQRWLRHLRQYLGVYDPEIERALPVSKSRAYPKITRVKCVSVLSRIMDLMFPSDDKNWTLSASPSPEMSVEDVQTALAECKEADIEAGIEPKMSPEYVTRAVQKLAEKRAKELTTLIDDQLQELGGDQTLDYIHLNREVIKSGILYGLGVLEGPYAREYKTTAWDFDPASQAPVSKTVTGYKPMFEVRNIWDFYPDMSAKTFAQMDGYFTRVVMSRAQVRDLARRSDFFGGMIKEYLNKNPKGNYKSQSFEQELRSMGVSINVNDMKSETMKYEVITWHGPMSGEYLRLAGIDVPDDKVADDLDAEIWMVEGHIIKCVLNPWAELGCDVRTVHTFLFDEDDTSPVGQGLPNILRDSQMSICAATRMMLDNASVVCGPMLEINTGLLRLDQDLTDISAYKIFYRDDDGPNSQYPAVRPLSIDGHLGEIEKIIEMFMRFADTETFVGPATGGDMTRAPSEPMRTAVGASMLRGDAALPFKDIIRNFDTFTQSVIDSLVKFNRKFNPDQAQAGDYNVVARGATSLIAKEVRAMQIDVLAQTIRPEEMVDVDERKFTEARFAVRDLQDLLLSEDEAERKRAAQGQQMAEQAKTQQELAEANIRKLLSDAFKNIAQGQKNTANADATTVTAALNILEKGLDDGSGQQQASQVGGSDQYNPGGEGEQPLPSGPDLAGLLAGAGQGPPGGLPVGGFPEIAG